MTVLKLQHTPGTRNKSTDTGNGPRELDTSWDNRASKIPPEGGGEGLAAPSPPHLAQEVLTPGGRGGFWQPRVRKAAA